MTDATEFALMVLEFARPVGVSLLVLYCLHRWSCA